MASLSPVSRLQGTIAVLGAGSLGRLWAARLPAGITGFVRRAERYQTGAHLTYHLESTDHHTSRIERPWLDDLSNCALLLVTTKAGDAVGALRDIMDGLPAQCPLVLFQNGMGSQQQVAGQWPDRSVLAASTTEAANRPDDTRVVHAATGQTWVGPLTQSAVSTTDQVVSSLARSGLSVQAEHNILSRLWAKLVINAGINPFTALLDCPNGDILRQPLFLDCIDPLCAELAALMEAEEMGPQDPAKLRIQVEQVAAATARNTSSMRADVKRGRPTEIDFINGYVATRSGELGLAAPVNRNLTERVKALV